MATTFFQVAAATTSAAMPITPLMSVCAGPAVLGGSVLIEFSPDGVRSWQAAPQGTVTQGASYRPSVNVFFRVTATTQAANVFVTDMGGANTPVIDQLVNVNNVLSCANATTEQILFSLRIPPGFLPLNSNIEVEGLVTVTNSATVKTLNCRVNGVAGTSFFTSPSLASNANYRFNARLCTRGDGSSWLGLGAGATGGLGLSTTAVTTLTRDYINQETEIVVTATKATGTDIMQVESLLILLR